MLHRFQYSGKKANLDFWSEDMEKTLWRDVAYLTANSTYQFFKAELVKICKEKF